MVTNLKVTFSEVVTFDSGAFVLRVPGSVPVDLDVSTAVVNGRTVATLRFLGAGIVGGSLADGRYTLTIDHTKVHDDANQALAADLVDEVTRLYGDIDGDGDVDNLDVAKFRRSFNARRGRQLLRLPRLQQRRRDRPGCRPGRDPPPARAEGLTKSSGRPLAAAEGDGRADARFNPHRLGYPFSRGTPPLAVPESREAPRVGASSHPSPGIATMRMIHRLLALALLIVVAAPFTARADPDYRYVFDASDYEVDPSGTVLVSVFLQETIGAGDTSLLSTEGLFGAGVRLTFGTGPSDPARIASASDVIANPDFDQAPPLVDFVPESRPDCSRKSTRPIPRGRSSGSWSLPDTFRILLGQFRFTAGAVAGEATSIGAVDFLPPPSDDTITGTNLTALDGQILAGSARILVRARPFPSRAASCSLPSVPRSCSSSAAIARPAERTEARTPDAAGTGHSRRSNRRGPNGEGLRPLLPFGPRPSFELVSSTDAATKGAPNGAPARRIIARSGNENRGRSP